VSIPPDAILFPVAGKMLKFEMYLIIIGRSRVAGRGGGTMILGKERGETMRY
jgi:hypothetical protein